MADLAAEKEGFVREFLCLNNGLPSHDTFSRLFRALEPEQFRRCFQAFMAHFTQTCQGVVAIDGKSCEITAVPELLKMLSLKGCVVTVDALNCQRAIAGQIIEQEGDYALALKGNQGTLHADVCHFLDDPASPVVTAEPVVDGDHGRIETRIASVSTDIEWLQEDHQWPGLKAVGKIKRVRETRTKTTTETAYYLLSTPMAAERFGQVVRAHSAVESSLHWVFDVTMNEDQARNRLDNGPNNLAVLRHMAINILNAKKSKISNQRKIKRAGWNNVFLAGLLAQF